MNRFWPGCDLAWHPVDNARDCMGPRRRRCAGCLAGCNPGCPEQRRRTDRRSRRQHLRDKFRLQCDRCPITSGNSVLFVIKPNGNLVRKVPIANSSPHTLGLAFNPVNGFLLVLDFGAGKVLHVDPVTGASSEFFNGGP